MKPSQDALPSSLQSTTTVTRHTGGGGTTPKPTPTKKVLAPDLQLSTLPALPGASDSATAAKSVTAEVPSKSVQPEAPSQAARTSVSIAPEPDEVVIVSTSTVTSVGQPPRLQQRKGINLGFCRNQEVNFQNQRYVESSLSQTEICRGSTSPDIASTSSPSLAPSSSSASSCSGWTRSNCSKPTGRILSSGAAAASSMQPLLQSFTNRFLQLKPTLRPFYIYIWTMYWRSFIMTDKEVNNSMHAMGKLGSLQYLVQQCNTM